MKSGWMTALALLLSLGAEAQADDSVVSTATYGAWTVDVLADAMTDKKRYIASVEGKPDGFLAFKCDPGYPGFYVSVSAGKYLGYDYSDKPEIILRIDKQPPRTETWGGSKTSMVNLDADYTHKFGKDLSAGTVLRTRMDTYDNETLDTEFSLEGAAKAIAEAMKGCDDPSRL